MSVTSAIVLYSIIWFMVLFVVLPLRLTTQGDRGEVVPGTHAGSPENPRMKLRVLVTTGVATVLWAVTFGIIVSGWIGVDDFDLFNRLGGGGQPYGTGG